MPIKRSSIENLKSRVSLLDVAGKYTQLKKRGHSYTGLSPFTKEKTPSFTIDPIKNVYFCFSSNQGGDLISFVQKMEKLEFNEAVESLAERYNVALEYEEGSAGAPRVDRSLKKELMEIHLYAAEFFEKAFNANHPEADEVREYWTNERKFSLDVAKEFGVGYAPASSNKLEDILAKKNFSPEAMKQCGLFFAPGRPRFRGRLMIPLRDVQGNVIAFTGRKLPQTPKDDPAFEAKYVNSPETLIFKKGGMLFNFDRARNAIDKQGFFLMVEGQLDALRVSSCGYPAVIAPQGTAITPEQLGLIKRYDTRLKIFLDGDRAGQAAAMRALPMALAAEIDITFLKLPPGIDPDLYFRENPEGGLKNLEALSPMKFAIQALWPAEVTAQSRTDALHKIFELILASPSAITHEAYLDEVIRNLHLEQRSVRQEFEKAKKGIKKTVSADLEVSGSDKKADFNKNLTTAEFELLWLFVHRPDLAPKVAHILEPAWLEKNDSHATLLNSLLADAHEGLWNPPQSIEDLSSNTPARDFLFGLLAKPLPKNHDATAIANNAIKAIYGKYLKTQLDELREELSHTTDPLKQADLLKKQQFLLNSQKKVSLLQHE